MDNYQVLDKSLYDLRDKLTKESLEIHKETYKCGNAFISERICYLEGKIYFVKRVNRKCVAIIDIKEKYKEIKNGNSSVDK